MDSTEDIPLAKSKKRNTLIKSISTNGFGTLFSYNLDILRKQIKSARTRNKTPKNELKLTKKLILPDEQLFFSEIKNKKVRNIYEAILRNSCKEKEPKTKHLKNIFRIKKTKNFLLKPNINSQINNKDKKSRTSNNLPFVQLSHNLNNINSFINHSNINSDFENKNLININKAKIPSLFLKKSNENNNNTNSNINQSYKKKILPISFDNNKNKVKKRKINNFFNELIFSEIKRNKKQRTVDTPKIRLMNFYDRTIIN